jgi:malonyl-CoA/methylmalonyl-CoA synthetase
MTDNLYDLIAARMPADRSACALETHDGQYWRWRDLEQASARIANLLASLQLPAQSRIAVQVDKSPEALCLYLATLRAGHVFLPLNTAYQKGEIAYFIEDAEPAVVVCMPSRLADVSAIAAGLGSVNVFTLSDDGSGSLIDAAAPHADEFSTVACESSSLAAVLYTSGTTGRSKGAMLSHGNLASNALTLHSVWRWRQDDVLLHALPIFHVHGLFVAIHGALLSGRRSSVTCPGQACSWVCPRCMYACSMSRPSTTPRPPACGFSFRGRRRCLPRPSGNSKPAPVSAFSSATA